MRFERYPGVDGHENVARITSALVACGARVIRSPDPTVAPYEYTIELPSNERRAFVCYAFTANKYRQKGRPSDEHRFQIKYGSDFKRYHDIFIDPTRKTTTLFFGVHREMDLFVAVDPLMHAPTWFSVSVEFKEGDLDQAKRVGWHGWERERSRVRRKNVSPLESFQTEAVCALTPENFLRYLEFERIAQGLDASERLLVGEEIARAPALNPKHVLEQQLGLSATELLDVLMGTGRLVVAVRGRVAEHHLGKYLATVPEVDGVQALDQDGPPDFQISYKERPVRIECKNVRRGIDPPRVDFQKTRASKDDACSRYYSAEQFEVLAACMHPVTAKWEYQFCATRALPPHAKCPGKLSDKVLVGGGNWTNSLIALLGQLR